MHNRKSPFLYALLIINALLIAFIIDYTQRKIINTADSYYKQKDALYESALIGI
ncbi:MAG: hypothetical protein KBD26_00580 [Candidatus Pacebacteria bacterium]|nr:hypothetical protein [Candidatus Paceibacterota bacterium]MBP9772305.1 hypothetical protein [Candidatus Paceibacterota bacterium]QQR76850.1 MAG: hypothetical protein IPJ63_01100 [Candidatus Nomurabacteria bacterium]